jgi:integrase
MASITALYVTKLKPREKAYKETVTTGLMVRVAPSGVKSWIVQYCLNGKQRDYALPELCGPKTDDGHLSLADAKDRAVAIRTLARKGVDPRLSQPDTAKEAEQLDVSALYQAWFPSLSRKDGGKELSRSFARDILPALGKRKLSSLVEGDITDLLRPMAAAGSNRTAAVTLSNLKQIFKWGEGRRPYKLVLDNPVASLSPDQITAQGYEPVERKRTLSQQEITEAHNGMKAALLEPAIEFAFWITLSSCTRIGETVKTKWADLNLTQGIWNIPKENSKNGKAHTVYLSDFTTRQFRSLQGYSGDSAYCFPNKKGTSHISPKAPNDHLHRRQVAPTPKNPIAGTLALSGGNFTCHDLRRTGATLLQTLDVPRHIIEHILNHAESDKLVRIYQTHDYATEQREAWSKLGQLLERLTSA